MTARPVLDAAGLTKSYGGHLALNGVGIQIESGEVVGLLGPNGAGKTTTACIIVGLIRPDAGRVKVDDIDVLRHPHRARSVIGYGPQATGVYEVLSVRDNLRFFGELAGLRGTRLRERLDTVVGALLLEDLTGAVCQRLSGGEKRRVHTAIALMGRPRLLLLDEPTVGADIATRIALLDVVRELAAEGTAVLYSTHYLPEIESLNAAVLLLDRGTVIAEGRVDDLISRHGKAALAMRFEAPAPAIHLVDGQVTRDRDTVHIVTPTPAATAARVLSDLGADVHRLRSLDVIHPSLESVFLTLTGRRYGSGAEADDVSAA